MAISYITYELSLAVQWFNDVRFTCTLFRNFQRNNIVQSKTLCHGALSLKIRSKTALLIIIKTTAIITTTTKTIVIILIIIHNYYYTCCPSVTYLKDYTRMPSIISCTLLFRTLDRKVFWTEDCTYYKHTYLQDQYFTFGQLISRWNAK